MAFSTYGYTGERSPDRADALVWAITELLLEDDAVPEAGFGSYQTSV
jgi:phage terminase large subunit-like protein